MNAAKQNVAIIEKMSRQGFEQMQQLGEINLHAMEQLMGSQMNTLQMFVENGLRQSNMISEAKGFNELIQGNMEMTKELTESIMNAGRQTVKVAGDTRDEYRSWFEKGVKEMTQNMSNAQASV